MSVDGYRRIGVMATYPARRNVVRETIDSIIGQVDLLYLCANEYKADDPVNLADQRIVVEYPSEDFKDVGKFIFPRHDTDIVFYFDDDIIYPEDYCDYLQERLCHYKDINAVVGLHGVIYSDFFDGDVNARLVFAFAQSLASDQFVNQLGTGTVACFGSSAPGLKTMHGSQKFVDVRFAAHCFRSGMPLVALSRQAGWLRNASTSEDIFSTFTSRWPKNVVREVNEFGGFRRLRGLEAKLA